MEGAPRIFVPKVVFINRIITIVLIFIFFWGGGGEITIIKKAPLSLRFSVYFSNLSTFVICCF